MTDIFELQTEFMEKAGQPPGHWNEEQAALYVNLIDEEAQEFNDALINDAESIKEACDILVVTAGYLVSLLGKEKSQQAYELVNASNMAKLDGKIIYREDGKVLKSPEWKKEIKEKLMSELAALIENENRKKVVT